MKNSLTLALMIATQGLYAMETPHQTDIISFLETIASAEPANWESTVLSLKKSHPEWVPAKKLNELTPLILKQENLGLIHLLERALRNNDANSEEKTEPFTLYYKNYQAPAFFVPAIDLTLDVQNDHVAVTSHLSITRNSDSPSLILDGKNHNVLSVAVNNQELSRDAYRVTPNELILLNAPKEKSFNITVKSSIDPFHNDALEGLYLSGEFLTTQCESEGARRIFFTLDRPDVLSRIQTTIVADPQKYPARLSNGNLVSETPLGGGRVKIIWNDPIPKPSYLFAAVMGRFGKIQDHFTTRSGRNVILEVFVEPGKEARAAYSMEALKLAMKFDEDFFDREYDLDYLKMVGVPDFNSGAMENKGLMIFNDICLLVDKHSGTDASFRTVAHVVSHEYFHNWSGNRVTVRNWFEIALKEAFTDFRAILFNEWLFGSAFIRPKDVMHLKEHQFPEETSGKGHPIMVESYVDAHSIYDSTTYTKGQEVFRSLQTYMDMKVPEGFRKAQNLYFDRYDGQAVTFRELLHAANDVLLQHNQEDLSQFELWFSQQGTPQIKIEMLASGGTTQLKVTQSCPHPKTGLPQKPFLIPFSYEMLNRDGSVALPKVNCILTEETHIFDIPEKGDFIPVFMHGYTAPVNLTYEYTLEELACIMLHESDPFTRWEAGQNYNLLAFKKGTDFKPYEKALESLSLPLLAKAQLLQIPTLRALSQKHQDYDFVKLKKNREQYVKELGFACKPLLEKLLLSYPDPSPFAPTSDQMQIRELRSASSSLLAYIDPNYAKTLLQTYKNAQSFEVAFSCFKIFTNLETPLKEEVIPDFYQKWKDDKTVFNYWLSAQASSRYCTVNDLKNLMETPGFDKKNPNHARSVLGAFTQNLGQYHDAKGEGYAFLVDHILEIGQWNPLLAHNYIATGAFIDFEKVPKAQQALMAREMKRLLVPSAPPQTRDLIKTLLSNAGVEL